MAQSSVLETIGIVAEALLVLMASPWGAPASRAANGLIDVSHAQVFVHHVRCARPVIFQTAEQVSALHALLDMLRVARQGPVFVWHAILARFKACLGRKTASVAPKASILETELVARALLVNRAGVRLLLHGANSGGGIRFPLRVTCVETTMAHRL